MKKRKIDTEFFQLPKENYYPEGRNGRDVKIVKIIIKKI